jgi:hypothetical protein
MTKKGFPLQTASSNTADGRAQSTDQFQGPQTHTEESNIQSSEKLQSASPQHTSASMLSSLSVAGIEAEALVDNQENRRDRTDAEAPNGDEASCTHSVVAGPGLEMPACSTALPTLPDRGTTTSVFHGSTMDTSPIVAPLRTFCDMCDKDLTHAEFHFTASNNNAEDEANEALHLCWSCKVVLHRRQPEALR